MKQPRRYEHNTSACLQARQAQWMGGISNWRTGMLGDYLAHNEAFMNSILGEVAGLIASISRRSGTGGGTTTTSTTTGGPWGDKDPEGSEGESTTATTTYSPYVYKSTYSPLSNMDLSFLDENIDYFSYGAMGGEILMKGAQSLYLSHRMSMPVLDKVGTFGSFAKNYRMLGNTGRFFGKLNTTLTILSVGLDYQSWSSGDISTSRFTYRTTGNVGAIATGAVIGGKFGGPWGAAAGGFVGGSFVFGEFFYDDVYTPVIQTIEQGISDFENYGWQNYQSWY